MSAVSVEPFERIARRSAVSGPLQGVVLSLLAILPTMGAVLIVPILPLFARAFATFPGIGIVAPVMLTLPALCIGLFSPLAGAAADRFGRGRLLICALVVYAIAGVAPALLNSIPLIIASRIVVGMSEAVIMTCCTTLVGDYFSGNARERWLSYQGVFVAAGATLLFVVGGMLGTLGWRAPFLAYAIALPLALIAALTLREPRPGDAAGAVEQAFPWIAFRRFMLLATFAAIAFYAVPVQLGFILAGIGIDAPQTIGLLAGLESLAVAMGALAFRSVSRFGCNTLVAAAAVIAGGGFVTIAYAHGVASMVVGLILNGIGTGLLIPTLLAMTMEQLPFELRGRGMGIYMGSFFIGQFASPIVVNVLGSVVGRLPNAIGLFGWVSLFAGCAGAALLYRRGARARGRRTP